MGAFQSQPESQPAAVAVQASHSKELPWGHSQWDRLPAELRVMILKEASILTRFLVGMVPGAGGGAGAGKKTLDKATVQLIWQEVIDSDWQGDLNLLPEITLSADSRADSSMQLVRSDELFLRLCARFPDQADSADTKSLLKDTNAYSAGMVHIQRLTARFIHIPMHNGWFDLLDFDAYRIAFGWFAIIGGHTDLLRHLAKDHGVDLAQYGSLAYISAMDWAAYSGHVDILQMLHDAGNTTCTMWAMQYATQRGQLDAVKWLHEHGYGCTRWAIHQGAERGHFDVVKFLHANRPEGDAAVAFSSALGNGHDHIAEWLSAHPRI